MKVDQSVVMRRSSIFVNVVTTNIIFGSNVCRNIRQHLRAKKLIREYKLKNNVAAATYYPKFQFLNIFLLHDTFTSSFTKRRIFIIITFHHIT